jgi:hypothetical protein
VEWTVAIGVDTHRDVRVAVALDRLGAVIGSIASAVDRAAQRTARTSAGTEPAAHCACHARPATPGHAEQTQPGNTRPLEDAAPPRPHPTAPARGDRQLNWSLHITALTRIGSHPETRAYYQRLQHRGKTKREAIRIIKRALARRLYHTLTTA